MKICIVGKYPPIQGGVSAQTFWLARTLARRGHNVHVVTNADEVEYGYRQYFFEEDRAQLSSVQGSGSVQVHNSSTLAPGSHIPWANPHATKLFGITVSVIQDFGCELIFGSYFEPYGFVATLAGMATGKPVLLRHAGSDVGHLAKHPDLERSYRWMLKHVSGIITTGPAKEHLHTLCVQKEQLIFLSASRLPQIFSEDVGGVPLENYLKVVPQWYGQYRLPLELRARVCALNEKVIEPSLRPFGLYGKVGETKGSFDLVKALRVLAGAGMRFNFVSIPCGTPRRLEQYFGELTSDERLMEHSWVLPPLPPWRIPSFLRRCDVVSFLERDFPIAIHRPTIPREILSSGACLVCSQEITSKQAFFESLVNGKNFVLVIDPKDIDGLAKTLERLMSDRNLVKTIGTHGRYLSQFWEQELPESALADAIETFGARM